MTDLDKGIFGTKVSQVGDKARDTTDSSTLCDSRHEVWVYTTDYEADGGVTPGTDNIVVSFVPTDTSGTGCIGAILDGSMIYITDPEEWRETVGEGMDILQDDYNQCKNDGGGWGCTDELLVAGTYAGIYGVTNAASYVGGGIVSGVSSAGSWAWDGVSTGWGLWGAEEYSSPNYSAVGSEMSSVLSREFRSGVTESGQDCFDDFGGTVFHNANGRGHKINISITCDGESMYETELGGTDARTELGSSMRFDPTMKAFKITKPGKWVVKVESLASHAECATPSLDESWTIDVAKPADWDESAPVIETQTEEVKEVMAKVDSQLETIGFTSGTDPLTVFAGIAIAGGLLVWCVLGMLS